MLRISQKTDEDSDYEQTIQKKNGGSLKRQEIATGIIITAMVVSVKCNIIP